MAASIRHDLEMWLPSKGDDDEPIPVYTVRWLRPHYATALLDLPSAPVAVGHTDHWHAFTEDDSVACEDAWQQLPEEARLDSGDGDDSVDESFVEEEEDVVGVAIYKDKLYE